MSESLFEIIENSSPKDKIMAYLQSSRKADIYLTSSEQEYMVQLDYADDLIRAHPCALDKELINMLVEKYLISTSKARNVLLDARYVHGTMGKPVKAYERQLLNQYLKEIMVHAAGNEDFKTGLAAADLYARLNHLDEQDAEGTDEGNGITIIRPAYLPDSLGVAVPDDLEELVARLRASTRKHQNILKGAQL